MRKEWQAAHKDQLFIHDNYHVSDWYLTRTSSIEPVIVRIFNALIEALNNNHHLPKDVVLIPDKDILESLHYFDFNIRQLIDDNINWFVRNMGRQLVWRWDDLKHKRIGSVTVEAPRIIWVKMLQQPRTDVP